MTTYALTHEGLQALVGRALIDPTFCRGLLSEARADCLAELPLTAEERQAASRIKADNLTLFAAELDAWMRARSGRLASVGATRTVRPGALAAA